MHVTQMNRHYNIILGQDFLTKLGTVLDFEQKMVQWGNEIFDMRTTECTQETYYLVHNTLDIASETDCMSTLLNTKYQSANIEEVAAKKRI